MEKCDRNETCFHYADDCTLVGAESRYFACFENKNIDCGTEEGKTETEQPIPETIFHSDETSETFTRLLPVCLEEDELAEMGAEMARLIGIWTKAKLDKKAFDKSIKNLIDDTETKYIEIAANVDAAEEEREVECYWQYDTKQNLKRLYRCDTRTLVEETAMTSEDLQKSFYFSISNVNALESEQDLSPQPELPETNTDIAVEKENVLQDDFDASDNMEAL